MHYRFGERPPKKPNRTVQKTSTSHKIYIENGSTSDFKYPCLYKKLKAPKEVKNPDVLKVWGGQYYYARWKPFRRFMQMFDCTPIHLMKEFTVKTTDGTVHTPSIVVALKGDVNGVSIVKTSIDDYVIEIVFSAQCPSCIEKIGKELFTIRLKYPILSYDKTSVTYRTSVVTSGHIIVKPAIL